MEAQRSTPQVDVNSRSAPRSSEAPMKKPATNVRWPVRTETHPAHRHGDDDDGKEHKTDPQEHPAVRHDPEKEGNQPENDDGMDHVPAWKGAQRRPDRGVGRPGPIDDELEGDVDRQGRRNEDAERHGGGAAEAPQHNHADETDHDGEVGRAELSHDLDDTELPAVSSDPIRNGSIESQQPLGAARGDDADDRRDDDRHDEECPTAQSDTEEPRASSGRP